MREDPGRLRFEIEAVDGGTRLTVTVHADKPAPRGFASTATGYHLCVDALVAHLHDEQVDLFSSERTATLETSYAAVL